MANDCKYQRKQYQISYDSGSTWHNAVPARYEKGELTEYSSPDCSGIEVQYRWRELEGQYICVDNNKYTKEVQEESYDNGATWYVSYPTVYKEGDFVEYNEEYCSFKFKGHYYHYPKEPRNCPSGYYWDGYRCRRANYDPLKIVKCNDNDTLTKSETTYYIPYDPIISAEIGSCAKTIGIEAFEFCISLSSVTIDNGVTSIEQKAFHGCVSITNIDIPDSVTNIGYMAFQGCTGLTSVTIGNGPTSIGNYAFYNCRSLQTIIMGNYITNIGNSAFQFCTGLTSIDIPNSVASIGNSAFGSCSGLTSIDIPNSVASIGNSAFTDCISLSSCTIGSGVTSIGDNAFTNCSSLVDVNIQSGSIGSGAFLNDYSITSLTLGNGVTSIGHRAFKDCTGITDVIIPDSVTDVGGESFRNCQSITGLSIGSGVTSVGGYAFSGCNSINTVKIDSQAFIGYYWPDSLRVVEIGGSVTSITDQAFYYSKASTITIGDSVTSIGSGAFYWCTNLTSIVIPDSVTSIGSGAFNGCDRLTSITVEATTPPTLGINAFNDTPIKRGGGTIYVPCESLSVYKSSPGWNDYFAQIKGIPPCEDPKQLKLYYSNGDVYEVGCTSYDVYIGSGNTRPSGYDYSSITAASIGNCVTNITSGLFKDCSGLTSIVIPDSVTRIYERNFYNCIGLTSVIIGTGVTRIDGYSNFSKCTSLTSIGPLGSGASVEIGGNINNFGVYTFAGCSGLTSVTIPDCVTSIGQAMFNGCTNMTSCTIGSGVTNIGTEAFYNCSGLTSIVIPDSVTSIGNSVFANCNSITSCTIGSGVTSIGSRLFTYPNRLTGVTVNAITPPTLGDNAFDTYNSNFPIYVPAQSVEAYKAADGWSTYASRIQAIP